MALIPDPNRVVVFIDGQNTYKRLIECFPAMPHPGQFDVRALANGLVGLAPGRVLDGIRYYTGIQDSSRDPGGYAGKQRYLAKLTADGVTVVQHPMKYSLEWVLARDQPATGPRKFVQIWQSREKGIDILLALDIVLMASKNAYDTAVIVSQDTDLDVAVAAAFQLVGGNRYLAVENAYIPDRKNKARIAQTTPRPLTRAMLEQMAAIEPAAAPAPRSRAGLARRMPPHG